MNQNVGSMDQYIRYVIGAVMLAAGIYYESLWGLIGLVPIITALLGWCPVFAIFRISSRKTA